MLTLLAAAPQPAYGGVMVSVARLRRFVLLVAALAALGVLVPAAASANNCPRPWSGSGTESDPYLVANQTDLNNIRACTFFDNLMVFKQTEDITLVGNWNPILGEGAFYGTYDGGGHTIKGLSISVNASSTGTGLFAVINGGTVKNLTIASAHITATGYSYYFGVLAGQVRGGATISNVHVTGTSTVSGPSHTGGLVGALQQGELDSRRDRPGVGWWTDWI